MKPDRSDEWRIGSLVSGLDEAPVMDARDCTGYRPVTSLLTPKTVHWTSCTALAGGKHLQREVHLAQALIMIEEGLLIPHLPIAHGLKQVHVVLELAYEALAPTTLVYMEDRKSFSVRPY